MDHEARFWLDRDEYHDLAETFERNIEYDRTAYEFVTSRRMCPCLQYCERCSFPLNGKVERVKYRGPQVV